jgi:cholesterol transport system auxiliary component
MNRYRAAPIALLTLPLALAGCISFGAKPPASLLTLTATAQPPVGQPQRAALAAGATRSTLSVGRQPIATVTDQPVTAGASSITIDTLTVPQEIATTRVPVHAAAGTVAYVKDAIWVEAPANLFARLLADTVTVRTNRVVLSTAQSYQSGSATLTGELRRFGLDAATRSAVVTFDAALIRTTGGGIEKQRFEATVPVTTIDAAGAGAGLNQAANQVAAQVADWVGR